MGLWYGIKSLFAFLTSIPVRVGEDSLTEAARFWPLATLVGAFIGLTSGGVAWVLLATLPALVAGAVTLGYIMAITGLHHTDGLLDFGDALIVHGPAAKKIEVMNDKYTGAGGLALGLIVLSTTVFAIASLKASLALPALASSEVTAKSSMVLASAVGRSAHPGLNTSFIEGMHSKRRILRLLFALSFSLVFIVALLGLRGLVALTAGLIASLLMVGISHRHFGGLTGDVFGAINEVCRMTSLVSLLVLV